MDNSIQQFDICVIGAGVSGLFIASKFINIGKKVLLIEESRVIGGQINLYGEKMVYNIPLISNIKSRDIVSKIFNEIKDSENLKLCLHSSVADISKEGDNYKINIFDKTTKDNDVFECKYIVIATGKGIQKPNKLPISGSEDFEGKTLFYRVNDKQIFLNKNIVIAGGGDSVIDWSCELYDIAKTIIVVHRRSIEHPENPQFLKFKELCEKGKILTKIPYGITGLNGENGVLNYIDIINNDKEAERINCDFLLAFYGLKSIQSGVDLYKKIGVNFETKGIKVNIVNNETDVNNIFSVGDCCYYEGKMDNIVMGFNDCMRCFYEICNRETGKIDCYGHK